MNSFLFLKYIHWHFFISPQEIIKGWGNLIWFAFTYFSVPLLIRTFFTPWRRITWSYGRGFQVGRFFYTLASNLISRLIGAFMRSILIVTGVGFALSIAVAGALFLVFWFVLPAIIVVSFAYGIFILFF